MLNNRRVDDRDSDYVLGDLRCGLHQLVGHRVHRGHQRIEFLADKADRYPVSERLVGYRQAVAAFGLPENPALVCFLDDLNQNYYDLTCNLARTVDPAPTAIFTYNDWNAVAVMRALIDLGYRVPHVSVVGYDNVESSGYPHPPLNSLPQQAYQIGQVGTEKLIEPIHWSVDQPWSEHHVFFNPELLVRASTSPGLLMDLIMPVVGQTQVGS